MILYTGLGGQPFLLDESQSGDDGDGGTEDGNADAGDVIRVMAVVMTMIRVPMLIAVLVLVRMLIILMMRTRQKSKLQHRSPSCCT